MRDTSHERNGNIRGNGESPQGRNHNKINGESGKSSKAKTHPARTSMNEMKRRVAAILEFVGQMQTQRSGSGGSSGKGNSGGGTPSGNGNAAVQVAGMVGMAGIVKAVQAVRAAQEDAENTDKIAEKQAERVNGEEEKDAQGEAVASNEVMGNGVAKLNLREDGEFQGMGSVDMMETLTRELVAWQRVYGMYSR